MRKLTINPEFEALIPPLSHAEREGLRASIKVHGIQDPIKVWRRPGHTDVIVDGHNRYRIAQELGITDPMRIPVEPLEFASEVAVRAWMLGLQLARRNLSRDQVVALLTHSHRRDYTRGTPAQFDMAAALNPDQLDAVIRGTIGLRAAYNGATRAAPKPRAAAAPATPVVQPTTSVEAIRERRAMRDDAGAIRSLQEQLADAHEALDFARSIPQLPPLPSRTAPKSGKRPGTPVTIASDWHFGETVTAEETNGGNMYSLAIAHERAARFWQNVLWLRRDIQRTVTAEDHVLSLNGDMISGGIHEELSATNEVGLVDQVAEVARALEAGIRLLAPTCRRLIIPCVHGNHGRSSIKSHIKDGFQNSFEALMYRHLVAACRDVENIQWLIPRAESVMVEVEGKSLRFQHGTFLRSSGGIGGILVPLTRWAVRQNEGLATRADYYCFGHFHNLCQFSRVIVNGSLIGDSSYNHEFGLGSQPPQQANFVIDGTHGLRRFDPVSVT